MDFIPLVCEDGKPACDATICSRKGASYRRRTVHVEDQEFSTSVDRGYDAV